jgi:electron transfer flavoprotein alpha subunit
MSTHAWVLATGPARLAGAVALARAVADEVTVVAVGPQPLVASAAAAGADRVLRAVTADGQPAEALAGRVAAAAAAAAPRLLVATDDLAARALLGAAAARTGAATVSGVLALRAEGDRLVADRSALDGAAVQTVTAAGPLAVQAVVEDVAAAPAGPAPVEDLPDGDAADVRVTGREAAATGAGLHDAARVVSVGRGLRAKEDLALVEQLSGALGAEIGCSMPVADDLGWVAKERYVGRSGQKIAPRLYLALGISGMPQHLEGVRDAKVVAAVNTDPDAPIFHAAGYGIVGDLYEVVPALVAALTE